MAYTAPNDLFTSEEAILSLASSIADEDRTNLGNGTINGALDVLADALAERNVEVPPMNAGAILALAQYVSGGGGGGGATKTIQLLCVEVKQGGTVVGPSSQGITAPTVAHLDWETQQGTLVDIGEKSTVTVDEVTGVWKYEFDVTVGEIYSIGGMTPWAVGNFGQSLNSDAQDATAFIDVFSASSLFAPTNYSTTVIVTYEDII